MFRINVSRTMTKKCKYRDPQPTAVRILGITETTENISFDTGVRFSLNELQEVKTGVVCCSSITFFKKNFF
jgi:hypothetical protein